MELSRRQKYVYYYVRYALMVYPFLLLIAICSALFGPPFSEDVFMPVLLAFFVPVFLAFWILPGIIYEGKWKGPLHGLRPINLKYNAFLLFTLGLGPLYVFFKKYDPVLKKYFEDQDYKQRKA